MPVLCNCNYNRHYMQIFLQIFTLLGALGMFLYGMTLMSEGLQKAAGDRLRSFLASMTSTPFKQVLTGLGITAVIQSSSATTVMVVSFVNAGLLTLANAIGVIMGANIGTTVTAWLISILGFKVDISILSIPLMAIGFVFFVSKKSKNKSIGEFIIGFALLFLGLNFLKNSVPDLNQSPEVLSFLQHWSGFGYGSVLIFVVIGTLLTIVLQSSSATMALTLVMVNAGWIPFDIATAMVLGENIGTTITANIAAAVANVSAKRAARAHTVFNVFGVIWVLILYRPFLKLIGVIVEAMGYPNPLTSSFADAQQGTAEYVALQTSALYGVSMLHTLFNTINTCILIWFVPVIEKLVTWMVKNPEGDEEIFRLRFIQGGPLSTAELSLDEAKQEIVHFAEVCHKGFGYVRKAINETDKDKFEELDQKLVKYEEITDRIEFEIASYLNEVSKSEISEESGARIKAMYKIIGEMESLGDSGEAIARMLQRKNVHGKTFDEAMLRRLNKMMDLVDKAYLAMIENLKKRYADLDDISNATDSEIQINEYRNALREEHIVNLESNSYNYQTGVFYMDIVSELEKMGDFIINISQAELAVANEK